MEVFNELGSGFLEPIYQEALEVALLDAGIPFVREKELTVFFRGKPLKKKYYADFVIGEEVILELKAVQRILPEHKAQLMNYLKATKKPLGFIINFHGDKLTWDRVVAHDNWLGR